MNLVIVKYNAGNIQSVMYALERIGISATVTDDHDAIRSADKVIFPGVGEASTAMQYLKQRNMDQLLKNLEQPVLGICLGMQLMCAYSEENDTTCLGIFEEDVKRFNPEFYVEAEASSQKGSIIRSSAEKSPAAFKVPQIGWNTIYNLKTGLFTGVSEQSFIYLVHSYYASPGEHTIASTDYILSYSSALHKNNFYGVQFHPEKSADVGERILKNFLEL
jgi:glutamine amidotransferase